MTMSKSRTGSNRALARTLGLASGAFVVATVVTVFGPEYLLPRPLPPSPSRSNSIAVLLQVKLFFSTFSGILLLVLLVTYARIYRDLPNRFTLSLLLFTVALALYALTANPLVSLLFGFRQAGGGPFTFLPDLFTAAAVVILLHQSYQ